MVLMPFIILETAPQIAVFACPAVSLSKHLGRNLAQCPTYPAFVFSKFHNRNFKRFCPRSTHLIVVESQANSTQGLIPKSSEMLLTIRPRLRAVGLPLRLSIR